MENDGGLMILLMEFVDSTVCTCEETEEVEVGEE